jgi:diguanylate cyclase (GGDEF)-like protein
VADCLVGAKPLDSEFRIVWDDGSVHEIRGTGRLTRAASGQPLHMIGTNRDITAFKEALRAREEIQDQVEGILENMNGYLFQRALSPDGNVSYPYVSESLYRMLGLPFEPGKPGPDLRQVVSPLDADRVEAAIRQSARDMTALDLEFRVRTGDDRELWISNRSSIRRLYDGTIIWDGFGTDITVEKRAAQQLFYLTYHDKLTGLRNRLGFEADLESAVTSAIENLAPFCVFFIDIVDFRAMNDTLGMKKGDYIINETARRLQTIAGADAVVARIAGDEFALLKRATDKIAATLLAERLCAVVAEPIWLGNENAASDAGYRIDVNIGIAGFPDEETSSASALLQNPVPECMKRCDIALYEAKRLGRGKFCHYSDDIDHRVRNRTLLQQSLHLALANNEFLLHYQPIFDFQSGKIIAAVALVRWQHPTLGFQPPDQFIPLAEESGLIVPLGAWVLKTSMTQIRQWRTQIGLQKIAVNVSGVQFSQTDFVEMVENLLRETGATPDMIELELTETTLIDCSPDMLARMNALRGMGFTLAIDDFGAGYSSLKYLSKLPVDKLKIDQWFVGQMLNDSSDAAIIRTIVALGKGLNLELTAEGVETMPQRDFLLAEGCHAGQGYLFSKPLAQKDFETTIKTRK